MQAHLISERRCWATHRAEEAPPPLPLPDAPSAPSAGLEINLGGPPAKRDGNADWITNRSGQKDPLDEVL
jgi:hypothetical protein